jgi:hypothetical protein
MAMAEQVERFKQQLASKRRVLWTLLSSLTADNRGVLRDAAVLALFAEPSAQDASHFIQNSFSHGRDSVLSNAVAMAALVIVSAASGSGPGDLCILAEALAELQPEQRARVSGKLFQWQESASAGAGPWQQVLTLWINFLNVPQELCPSDDPPAAAEVQVPPQAVPAAPAASPASGLRAIVQDAPPNFRCALDGQLLVDPVRSPTGHVFERSVLARHLQGSGGVCPVTGAPLTLEQCQRDPEMRKHIAAWIKSNKDRQKGPMMFSPSH